MDLSGSWEYIQSTARSRLAHNRTPRHVYGFGDGLEVLGVAGEIIARRFLGLPELVHKSFDGGVDLRIGHMTIDVKTTVMTPRVQYRYLQIPEWKKIKSNVVLLTAVDPVNQVGTVIGYATREEIEKAPVNRYRYTPCHEVPVSELHPAWELVVQSVREAADAAFL